VLRGYACRKDADGRTSNPIFCSPTDNLLTPCTRKLSAARKKHFNKYAILTTWARVFWLIFLFRLPKTVQLFPQAENIEPNEEQVSEQMAVPTEMKMEDDDENPF
jgi:Spo12 family